MTIDEFAKEITVTVDEVADWIEKELKIKPMIKANELRIDNIVLVQTLNVIPVNFMNKEMVRIGEIDPECFPDDPMLNRFMGIELTPEILEKCGFERVDNKYQKNWIIKAEDNYHSVQFTDEKYFYSNDKSDAGCYVLAEVRYLHQLQNLYFCLTGEELSVEL